MDKYISIAAEVKQAQALNIPVVALESTIIAHGMPYPDNVKTALEAEEIIRKQGCIPATIAIIDGVIKVGLTASEIDYLGQNTNALKTSTRDIPYIISKKLTGATTVASTVLIAELANIHIFATGGIGGVHKDVINTMDISNDLEQIAKSNVAIICAGAKAILDLEKTLEYLETKGVLVLGYQTDYLPAFYSSQSSHQITRINTTAEIADILKVKWEISKGGVIIANPIPKEYEIANTYIDNIVNKAITEMNDLGIKGKETTPYLLKKITELTNGKSLKANIELFYNNCLVAAQIAKDLGALI